MRGERGRPSVEERPMGLDTKDSSSIAILHAQGLMKILFDGKIGALDQQFQ